VSGPETPEHRLAMARGTSSLRRSSLPTKTIVLTFALTPLPDAGTSRADLSQGRSPRSRDAQREYLWIKAGYLQALGRIGAHSVPIRTYRCGSGRTEPD
jgi:hypothetical protein